MVCLNFRDTIKLYRLRKDGYGDDSPEEAVELNGMYEQVTGYEHASNRDGINAASRLYLPANNDFLLEVGYRLEGMKVQINPYDAAGAQQFFRISTVTPVRDILLCNQVQHVECDLVKVENIL
jgi:hypothetical protein